MKIHFFPFSTPSIFKPNILSASTAQQKKIIMIVFIIFGLLSASYLIIRCFKFKKVNCNVSQIETVFKEEVLQKEIDEKEKLNQKRKNLTFDEVLQSEKKYKVGLDKLAKVKEIYQGREDNWLKMVKSNERHHLKACFEQLFQIVDQLRNLSDEIFADVEGLKVESSDQEFSLQFGKFFTKFEQADFTLFGKFAETYKEMMFMLNPDQAKDPKRPLQIEINKVFAEQIDEGSDFDDIMITPIQRMPRYQLLLIELRKRISNGSKEAENLDHLINIATQANISNNDQLKPVKRS